MIGHFSSSKERHDGLWRRMSLLLCAALSGCVAWTDLPHLPQRLARTPRRGKGPPLCPLVLHATTERPRTRRERGGGASGSRSRARTMEPSAPPAFDSSPSSPLSAPLKLRSPHASNGAAAPASARRAASATPKGTARPPTYDPSPKDRQKSQQQQQQQQREKQAMRQQQRTAAPGQHQPGESTRLAKAKLILEQIGSDDDQLAASTTSLLLEQQRRQASSAAPRRGPSPAAPSSSRQSFARDAAQRQKPKQLTMTATGVAVAEEEEAAMVIPDNLWSNGHLMDAGMGGGGGRGVVTRWARGKKVAEPLVKYDPVAAEAKLWRQINRWVIRNFQIAVPLGYWAVSVVLDYVSGRSKSNRRMRAEQLRSAISDLGPAIIKGGQALASRPDLLPSEYLEELQKLQDDVPRFSNARAFRTVEEELGIEFGDVFELVEPEPVAAASIGQVYKARLVENGDLVAIKIQRPKCEEIIALDLYVLRWWGGIYNQIFRALNRDIDVQAIIDDFGELIYREIDYVAEASNAQRFNELYAGVRDVFVPKIYSDLTTSKVLTMEWVDGFRLTDAANLSKYNLDESKLVDTLVQCSLRQILENGFFHADPHAGNLLAQPDGRLCYLDFGMMSYATSKQRNGFLLAVVHIVNRDWAELVRLYQRLGFIPEGTNLKPIEVALENAMPDVLNADISELNFKNVINKLGDIMYTYPFSLPPFYIAIIRCLGVLEGLAIQVDPTSRIVSKAYPYVASRVLTDPQAELQEAFRRLAFNADGSVRWGRLEGLLEEAKESSGYDVSAALDLMTNYILTDEGDALLRDLSVQIVDAADNLGSETVGYTLDAFRALAINDEVAAVRAFRSLQEILQESQAENGSERMRKKVTEDLRDVLPDPTPGMKRFWKIVSLVGSQNGQTDPAKFVPILRKLSQEPRVQRTVSEVVARLAERMLSRGLRAAFGLPPPIFGRKTETSTVTEDMTG